MSLPVLSQDLLHIKIGLSEVCVLSLGVELSLSFEILHVAMSYQVQALFIYICKV